MNVVEVEDVTLEKVSKWESDLWSYISKGDGEHCPLYDRCRIRKECSWCVSEHSTEIGQLLEKRQFDIAKSDFVKVEPKRLGKPFRLTEMLAQRCLKEGKVYGPPVPVELASLFDIERAVEIHPISLKTYHGAIWRLRDRWVIQLRNGDTPVMKRFILFHETFHILAHCQGVPVFKKRGVEQGRFNEVLADYFAACILMPREWVRKKWVEVKDLDSMTKTFDVPKVVMWIRLRQLGLV